MSYPIRPEMDTPEYRSWRFAVFARDEFQCVKCGKKGKLNAHHIKKFADYPTLRYVINNGVTLCEICHDIVTGREEAYEDEFKRIVESKKLIQKIQAKKGKRRSKYYPRNPNNRYGY